MSDYRCARTRDLATVERLDREIFPYDEPVGTDYASWWVLTYCEDPVGFGGVRLRKDGLAYLCRSGVLHPHRGQGLQRELICRRVAHARRQDMRALYAYTMRDNLRSANNLIKCGFRLYDPTVRFAGEELYFWRSL